MVLVTATAGDDVDDGPGVATELGVEVVGDDAELLSGVRIGGGDAGLATGDRGVVVIRTIEHEVVVAVALAVYGKSTHVVGGCDDAG